MRLVSPEVYKLTLDRELLEDWIDRDARERSVLPENQYMKISSLEYINEELIVTLDVYEEYLN